MSEAQVERGSVSSFGILRRDKTGPSHGPCEHPALRIRLDLATRRGRVYISIRAKTKKRKFRIHALPPMTQGVRRMLVQIRPALGSRIRRVVAARVIFQRGSRMFRSEAESIYQSWNTRASQAAVTFFRGGRATPSPSASRERRHSVSF